METTLPPYPATSSSHRPAADSSGTLLPPDWVGGATSSISRSARHQIASFVTIGLLSTIAYLVLYAALRATLGRTVSNALALVITSVANTGANRRLTFGVRGRDRLGYDHVAGLVAFAGALALTTTSITLLGIVAPGAGRLVEIGVLMGANLVATAVRFVLLRSWIGSRTVLIDGLERGT
jgi:putative flippase GtrA